MMSNRMIQGGQKIQMMLAMARVSLEVRRPSSSSSSVLEALYGERENRTRILNGKKRVVTRL